MTYRTIISAAAFAVTVLFTATAAPAPAAAASGESPYCVLPSGPDGPGSSPQVCGFWDYQQCLQAASDMRGNCVQNIDYHGGTAPPSAPARTRHRR